MKNLGIPLTKDELMSIKGSIGGDSCYKCSCEDSSGVWVSNSNSIGSHCSGSTGSCDYGAHEECSLLGGIQ